MAFTLVSRLSNVVPLVLQYACFGVNDVAAFVSTSCGDLDTISTSSPRTHPHPHPPTLSVSQQSVEVG